MPDLPANLAQTLNVPFPHTLRFTRDVFAPGNTTLAEVLTPREGVDRVRVLVVVDEGLVSAMAAPSGPDNALPNGAPQVRVAASLADALHPMPTAAGCTEQRASASDAPTVRRHHDGAARPDLKESITTWFAARTDTLELAAPPMAVAGGEKAKNDFGALETLWAAIADAHLCRHSYVVAIGGGALLDLVGFAAATAHRGIPLVRLPTTSMSQGDSGVGVKCGVNFFGKKNWLGAFGTPHAVINDLDFLQTLPPRERRAGLAEALKVALIRDAAFFERLAANAEAIAAGDTAAYEHAIATSAHLHFQHIVENGDPFERGSARPLDFGHWSAHKLEQLSGFRLGHGDAVAIGLAIDLIYARRTGLLDAEIAARAIGLLTTFGFTLFTPELEQRRADGHRTVLDGLEEFREHLGGRLSIPMIRAPGARLDLHTVDLDAVEAAIDELRDRHG